LRPDTEKGRSTGEGADRFARAAPDGFRKKRPWWVADVINMLLMAALLAFFYFETKPTRGDFLVFCLIGLACVGGLALVRAGLRWEQRRWERRKER